MKVNFQVDWNEHKFKEKINWERKMKNEEEEERMNERQVERKEEWEKKKGIFSSLTVI